MTGTQRVDLPAFLYGMIAMARRPASRRLPSWPPRRSLAYAIIALVVLVLGFLGVTLVGDHRDFDRVSTCELVEQSPASRNPSQFGRWIQALQFEAGIHRAETPVDHGMVMIALGLPRIDFSA
jgi:hypothetical protein